MKTIRIQTMFLQRYVGHRGTDWLYIHDLVKLQRDWPLQFSFNNRLRPYLKGNVGYMMQGILRRLPVAGGILHTDMWKAFELQMPGRYDVGADILFSNSYVPSRSARVPFVLEADFVPYGATAEMRKTVERVLRRPEWLIDRCDVIVMRTASSAEYFRQWYPRARAEVAVIPYYLPYLEAIDVGALQRKWEVLEPIRIVYVGNQARRKGLSHLAAAVTELRKELDVPFCFEVISNFNDGAVPLPQWIKVSRNVSRDYVIERMRGAHIFAMTTFREALGKVFSEAMASGCVLLTPDWYPMVTEDFSTHAGVTVDVMSVESIKKGLGELISRAAAFRSVAEGNHTRFLTKYAPETVGRKYYRLFERLC